MANRDTFHVVLWNQYSNHVERVIETFGGTLDERESAVKLAEDLTTLREHLLMLGVQFSANYRVRIQQVRRPKDPSGGLYGASKKRFLDVEPQSDDETDESFWANDPDEEARRVIERGRERIHEAETRAVNPE